MTVWELGLAGLIVVIVGAGVSTVITEWHTYNKRR